MAADDVSVSEAYDALDPNGNITIKWDIMSWTADGYVVSTYFSESMNVLRSKYLGFAIRVSVLCYCIYFILNLCHKIHKID